MARSSLESWVEELPDAADEAAWLGLAIEGLSRFHGNDQPGSMTMVHVGLDAVRERSVEAGNEYVTFGLRDLPGYDRDEEWILLDLIAAAASGQERWALETWRLVGRMADSAAIREVADRVHAADVATASCPVVVLLQCLAEGIAAAIEAAKPYGVEDVPPPPVSETDWLRQVLQAYAGIPSLILHDDPAQAVTFRSDVWPALKQLRELSRQAGESFASASLDEALTDDEEMVAWLMAAKLVDPDPAWQISDDLHAACVLLGIPSDGGLAPVESVPRVATAVRRLLDCSLIRSQWDPVGSRPWVAGAGMEAILERFRRPAEAPPAASTEPSRLAESERTGPTGMEDAMERINNMIEDLGLDEALEIMFREISQPCDEDGDGAPNP